MLKKLRGKVAIAKDAGKITVVASDETLDRHGDVLPIEQWDISKFVEAPRMLIDHDHSVKSIVGRWRNPRIVGKQLLMDAEFHAITPLAKEVCQMVEEGFLNTVSVGFIWHEPDQDGGRPSFELIETSWVSVPANPSARVQASLKSAMESALAPDVEAQLEAYAKDIDAEEDDERGEDEGSEEDDEGGQESDDGGDEGDQEEDHEPVTPEGEPAPSVENPDELAALAETVQRATVPTAWLRALVADSEKLKTLTAKAAQKERREAVRRAAMKAAAGQICHALSIKDDDGR